MSQLLVKQWYVSMHNLNITQGKNVGNGLYKIMSSFCISIKFSNVQREKTDFNTAYNTTEDNLIFTS